MNPSLPIFARRSALAVLLLSLFGAAAVHAAAPKFRITDLGTGTPVDINDKGQVLINSGSAWIAQVVWQNGVTTEVAPGSDAVYALNDAGRVAGSVTQPDYSTIPAWWKPGKAPTLLAREYPSGVNRGTSIGNDGTVAGWTVLPNGAMSPAIWRPDGSYLAFDSWLPEHSYAHWNTPRINNKGVVAVPGWDHAFRVDTATGRVDTLLGFGTGLWYPLVSGGSLAAGINDKNWVVGHSHATFTYPDGSTGARYQATLWKTDNRPIDLGVLTSVATYPNVHSTAYGINNSGVVVGTTYTTGSWGGPSAGFGWTAATGIVDLNTLIDPADPLAGQVTLLSANAINDKNQIVGLLNGPLGVRGYLLTLAP